MPAERAETTHAHAPPQRTRPHDPPGRDAATVPGDAGRTEHRLPTLPSWPRCLGWDTGRPMPTVRVALRVKPHLPETAPTATYIHMPLTVAFSPKPVCDGKGTHEEMRRTHLCDVTWDGPLRAPHLPAQGTPQV